MDQLKGKMWGGGDESDESDENEASTVEETAAAAAAAAAKAAPAKARFAKYDESDSEESDNDNRVARSAKDRTIDALLVNVKAINNHLKTLDWNLLHDEFEKLNRAIEKAASIIKEVRRERACVRCVCGVCWGMPLLLY